MYTKTMNKRVPRFALGLALLGLGASALVCGRADDAPASKAAVTAPTWGVADPLTRLLPIDSYDGPVGGTLALTGARQEVVDKQLVLLSAGKPWRGVRLSFSDLKGPNGAVIPGAGLRWRPIGSVRTRRPKYDTRYVGQWPDPLLPPAPFDVAPRGRASVWVDLTVPADAHAGTYAGTVTVSSTDTAAVSVPLSLRVWNFTLPHQPHLRSAFGIQNMGGFPLDGEAAVQNLLAHRISPVVGIGQPRVVVPPGPGQPGKWDWTDWDRAAEIRRAQGITAFRIDIGEPKAAWAKEWQTHLQAKGLLPYAYTYIADEPEGPQLVGLNAKLGEIKQAAPLLHNLMTAKGYPAALSYVDIWCPEIIHFDPKISRDLQGFGRASWWYPAYSTPHPRINVWTDYPALDCRIWPWMTWKYDLDGILYWTVCNWQPVPDPLQEASFFNGGEGVANGDGELIYPGPGGRPLDSIRWEAIRDGMQDYEVFCLLEAGARELQAAQKSPDLVKQAQDMLTIDPSLIASFTQYNPDPEALLATRERMSRAVEQIIAALGHEPAIKDRPRIRPGINPAELPRIGADQSKAQNGPR